MSRRMNIYYNAVLGGLGGLLGWALLGLIRMEDWNAYLQSAVQGAVVGALVAALVSSVEGALNANLRQALRGLFRGLGYGLIAGTIGLLAGELSLRVLGGGYAARSIGWAIFGLAVGISEGRANRSPRKASYGAVGGTIGGVVGGLIFEWVAEQGQEAQDVTMGVGLVLLGACIGSLLGLVSEAFVRARIRILSGAREGREYNLERTRTSIGSSDSCDIYLPRDPDLKREHAFVVGEKGQFKLQRAAADAAMTVNDKAITAQEVTLRDGDRLLLGGTQLLVHLARH